MKKEILLPEISYTKTYGKPTVFVGGGSLEQTKGLLGFYVGFVKQDGSRPELLFVNKENNFIKRGLVYVNEKGYLVLVKRYSTTYKIIYYKYSLESKTFIEVVPTSIERITFINAIKAFKEETLNRNTVPVFCYRSSRITSKLKVSTVTEVSDTLEKIAAVANKLNKLPFNIDFKYIEAYSDKKELNTFYVLDPYCQAYCIKAVVDVKESVIIDSIVY
jgi:hypothetical protein